MRDLSTEPGRGVKTIFRPATMMGRIPRIVL